jgi:hypothetical protein
MSRLLSGLATRSSWRSATPKNAESPERKIRQYNCRSDGSRAPLNFPPQIDARPLHGNPSFRARCHFRHGMTHPTRNLRQCRSSWRRIAKIFLHFGSGGCGHARIAFSQPRSILLAISLNSTRRSAVPPKADMCGATRDVR